MSKKIIKLVLIALLLVSAAVVVFGCATPKAVVKGVSNNGMFAIECNPSSAEVYVDGQLIGKAKEFDGSPKFLEIASGTHRLELRAPGYQTWQRDVYSSNSIQRIQVTLAKVPN